MAECPNYTTFSVKMNVTVGGKTSAVTVVMDATKLAEGGPLCRLQKTDSTPIGCINRRPIAAAGFMLTHCRWGHGVGMSQCGAGMMPKNHGKSYREIIAFYYPYNDKSAFDCRREGNSGTVGSGGNEPEGQKVLSGWCASANDKASLIR